MPDFEIGGKTSGSYLLRAFMRHAGQIWCIIGFAKKGDGGEGSATEPDSTPLNQRIQVAAPNMTKGSGTGSDDGEPPKAGDLARRIMGGDNRAADEFVRRYYSWLLVIVRRKFSGTNFQRDVVQEAFIATITSLRNGTLHNPDGVLAFLRKAGINIGYEYLRKEQRNASDCSPELLATIDDIAEACDWERKLARVRRAIERLPTERDREILRRVFLGQDKSDICRDLGLTSDHYYRVLFRAKQRLMKLLDDDDDDTPPSGSPSGNGSGGTNGNGGNDRGPPKAPLAILFLGLFITAMWLGLL